MTMTLGGCAMLGLSADAGTDAATEAAIAKAAIGSHRSAENIARNAYRHPVETLSFFGLRQDMTVIEILPGGLWYTAILAPVVAEQGQYIAAGYDIDLPDQPDYRKRGHDQMVKRFKNEAAVFGNAKMAKMKNEHDGGLTVDCSPPHDLPLPLARFYLLVVSRPGVP